MVGILESAALVLKSLRQMSCLWSRMVSYLVSAFVNDLKSLRCCGVIQEWLSIVLKF